VSAAGERFDHLYDRRTGVFSKDASDEEFLVGLNQYLEPRELELYGDYDVAHPFLFVVGLPRSGTTLLSQLLAYCLDVGYITNVAARFWRAPLHGIRLSQLIMGESSVPSFESQYARTQGPLDIHEFGYFWRYWLKKHTFEDVVEARERESEMDWVGLRRTLANIQHVFGKPFVGKNMLGAYHMPRLRDTLRMVVYVYIERDPLDVALSILDARRKYYSDPDSWWSYVPLEYPLLKDRDHWGQIAGQVHYLTRFYERAFREVGLGNVVRVSYEQLCADPESVLEAVARVASGLYGCGFGRRRAPPPAFAFRRYLERDAEKATFADLLRRLRADDP
jgi:LPS sulfotransferase NodH